MLSINALFKLRRIWHTFNQNHPRVPQFMENVKNKGFCENMEIAIAVRYPDGEEFKTGIRVNQNDIDLIKVLETMKK